MLNDCGKHYGAGGKCHKCAYFNSDEYRRREYRNLQHQGDSWWAILWPSVPDGAVAPEDANETNLRWQEANHQQIRKAESLRDSDPIMAYALLVDAIKKEVSRLDSCLKKGGYDNL